MDPARMVSAAQRLKAAGRTEEAVEILSAVCERWPEPSGSFTRPPASTSSFST